MTEKEAIPLDKIETLFREKGIAFTKNRGKDGAFHLYLEEINVTMSFTASGQFYVLWNRYYDGV